MKAFIKTKYGGPEVLRLEELEKPSVKDGHILVEIKANSANPADWHVLRGEPFLARLSFGLFNPKVKILGADFAGIVQEVGAGVSHFKVGDLVFGESLKTGAFAEYICVEASVCGKMEASVSFAEMAGVPIAGVTALQALSVHGKLQEGESVLINGSSGGVGHFTVQIAKTLGATVTAVCSSKSAEFVRSLGADHVLAYDRENIHKHQAKYDLVVDNNGNLNFEDFKRMGHRGVTVGFTNMAHMMKVLFRAALSKFKLAQFTAEANTKDLEILAGMIETKKVRVHIEKIYPYEKTPEAIAYIEAMRTKGKVVMVWDEGLISE